jgi:hypothetical protein
LEVAPGPTLKGVQVKDDLKRALESAGAKEVEAEAFYRSWSERAKDPGVKKLFSELAVWEHEHAEKLSRITPDELIAQGQAPQDLKISDLLVDVKAQPDMTLLEALALAIKREQAAASLYEGMAMLGGARPGAVLRLGGGGAPPQAPPGERIRRPPDGELNKDRKPYVRTVCYGG